MAQQLIRPVRLWPRRLRHHYSSLHRHHPSSPPLLAVNTTVNLTSFVTVPISHRTVHFKSRGLKLPNAPVPTSHDAQQDDDISDSESDRGNRSRNVKKREARRAVRWGMDLALFSDSQIKRILRVASLEQEVFDALMLVKRLGSDVREGKRRQYNLIGKLLKNAEPEMMDTLIQATKDGDHSRIKVLSDSVTLIDEDNNEEKAKDLESDDDEEISNYDNDIATRWYDGLISKDVDITNEVYSIHSIDFDRQELRKLVRKVHSIQEQQGGINEENKGDFDASLRGAKKSLTRFLRSLAKRMPID